MADGSGRCGIPQIRKSNAALPTPDLSQIHESDPTLLVA